MSPIFDRVLENLMCLPRMYQTFFQVFFGKVVFLNMDLPCLASSIKLYFRIILHSEPNTVMNILGANVFNPHSSLMDHFVFHLIFEATEAQTG